MQEAMETEASYLAFLSYSHKDAGWARRLQRRLEAYKLPKGLALKDGAVRLGPVFRDQDELAAASDLSQSVKDGIARSGAMIVLCSPSAAASLWVDKEIRLFRQVHPTRPILAAIIEGDPVDAFPTALTQGAEPLAADLRPEGDGARLGTLKLIAGLAEVRLDQLVQRDAQRRMRRVTAITVLSLIIALGFVTLSLFAWQAQREAERQRAEAEGIVEFMLTDLRQRLRSVGRLDALMTVNQRAMNYYKAQGDLDRLSDESLERRARILHAMGEDDIARGDLAAASLKFKEAHRTTDVILQNAPDDPERIFNHAQSEFWIGQVDQLEERAGPALSHYRAYLYWAHRLVELEPRKSRSLTEVGYALSNIAAIQWLFQKNHTKAIWNYQKSLDWFLKAQALNPTSLTVRKEVAERHARISDVQFDRGDFDAARWHRLRQLALLEPLRREDPDNGDLAYETLVATRALARIAFGSGKLADAANLIRDAEMQALRLRERDSANQYWFEQHLRVLADAAEVAHALHRSSEVARLTDEARDIMSEVGSDAAAVPAFRAESIQRLDAIAHLYADVPAKGK